MTPQLITEPSVPAAAPPADLTVGQRTASRMTWRRLVVVAALGDLVMLAWLGLVAQDKLALSVATGLVIGLAFIRVRGGLAGRIILALAFADLSWYTVSGAAWNILNREGFSAVLVPAWLGTWAVAGLIAAIAAFVTRAQPRAGRTAAVWVGAVAAACFALAIAASAIGGRAARTSADALSNIPVTTENMIYSNKNLTAESGQVTVRLKNKDLFWHTFTIDALGVDLKVPVNGDELITFSAAPGTYAFYCTIPGHAQLGMRGTLVVR